MEQKVKTLFDTTYYTEEDLAQESFRSLGKNVRIAKNCTIVGAENISIGDNVRIDGYSSLVASGEGYIELGSYIHIGGNCVLLGGAGIRMETFSTLSWGVKLFSRSDDFSGEHMTNPTVPQKYTKASGGEIAIKKHVIVGANSIILPKVTLSEGVAVGALTLVNKSLNEWGIYSGNPAKRIKERNRKLLTLEKEFVEELKKLGTPLKQIYID